LTAALILSHLYQVVALGANVGHERLAAERRRCVRLVVYFFKDQSVFLQPVFEPSDNFRFIHFV